MRDSVDFIRKCWRILLKEYYKVENSILTDPEKLERFKWFLEKLPIQNNKIVFDNFIGKAYGENPKYICDEFLRRNSRHKLIWLCNDLNINLPVGVYPVYRHSLRAYYESATAKAWVFNTRNCKLTSKRKEQIYLQTWHGPVPLKKIEKDAEANLSNSYVKTAKEDGTVCTGILVDGAIIEDVYRRAFWLNEKCELLHFGSPRSDILLNAKKQKAIRQRVCNSLGVDGNSFIVLYAPTFRDNHSIDGFIRDLNHIEHALKEKFGNVSIVIRLHPNDIDNAKELFETTWKNYKNATAYSDIQELVIASNCLITDYSSISYDFAIMKKPVFLCMKDFDQFLAQRGVYNHFYEQPFTLNYDENGLINEINSFDYKGYLQRLELFEKKYPSYNKGNASAEVVDWLIARGLKDRRF